VDDGASDQWREARTAERSGTSDSRKGTAMLSREILEAQETVEMPAREMMRVTIVAFNNFSSVDALQANGSLQFGGWNSSSQGNAIVVEQGTGIGG
jgi:hypothetical protein